jgi:hypothetical protein
MDPHSKDGKRRCMHFPLVGLRVAYVLTTTPKLVANENEMITDTRARMKYMGAR